MRGWRLAGLSLLAVWVATVEAAPVPVPGRDLLNVPVQSLVALRFKNVVRQAYDVSCGAAALATLLKYYYGEQVTEHEIVQAMLKLGDAAKIQEEGFSLLEMKRYAQQQGYVVGGYRLDDVHHLNKLNAPVITLMNIRGYAHFVVIKGVAEGQVFIADPAFGNRSQSLEQFAQEWNRTILVILSNTNAGQNAFTLDPALKAPMREVILLLDRALHTITPAAGEF
jgi:predicted double-glycine peptidase